MKRKLALSFIVLGAISVIFGIIMLSSPASHTSYYINGSEEELKFYGTEGTNAYTGIQHAAAKTATNITYVEGAVESGFNSVVNIASLGFGFMLIIMGGILILFGIYKKTEKAQIASVDTISQQPVQPNTVEQIQKQPAESATVVAQPVAPTAEQTLEKPLYEVRFIYIAGKHNVNIVLDDKGHRSISPNGSIVMEVPAGNHTVELYNGVLKTLTNIQITSDITIEIGANLVGKPYFKNA